MEKKRNGKKSVVSRVWTLNLMDQKFSPLPTKLMIGFGLLDAFNFFYSVSPQRLCVTSTSAHRLPTFPPKKCGRGGSNPHL
jgi:hypothetical protein